MEQLRIRKPRSQPRRSEEATRDLAPDLRRALSHRRALGQDLEDLIHDIERVLDENA